MSESRAERKEKSNGALNGQERREKSSGRHSKGRRGRGRRPDFVRNGSSRRRDVERAENDSEHIFLQHWSVEETHDKLKSGQCFSGTFRINVKSGDEGYISLQNLPEDPMFRQGRFQNRAIAGDVIAFRVLPSSYWWIKRSVKKLPIPTDIPLANDRDVALMSGPSRRMALLRRAIHAEHHKRSEQAEMPRVRLPAVWDHVESAEEAKDLIKEVLKYFPELRPTAEVVRILEETRRRQAIVGTLLHDPQMPEDILLLLPQDNDLPKAIWISKTTIRPEQQFLLKEAAVVEKETRTLVQVALCRWQQDDPFPFGMVVEVIGPSAEIEEETKAIFIRHNINLKGFKDEALACLPSNDWHPDEEDLKDRIDFREACVISIDPPSARDLDDALSIEMLDQDRYRVGVHIADVAHFVKSGSALDLAAQERTTSVYMVQRVIPMLPELLSSNLCSLRPGEERLTFSVVWVMNDKGEILDEQINKTIIKSAAKLAYHHAQSVIENPEISKPEGITIYGDHSWEQIKTNILTLFKISQELRRQRFENGALQLDTTKISFELGEDMQPIETTFALKTDANHLIQDFMLLANESVAKVISDTYPSHSLLRLHPAPNTKHLQELQDVARELDVDLEISSARSIQKGMAEMASRCADDCTMESIVQLATRGMRLARYFCTGSLDKEEWTHYALAMDTYTHFTSPIRRYPDILVHRLLHSAITTGMALNEVIGPADTNNMQLMADRCNNGKMSARSAQDDSISLFLRYWLYHHPTQTHGIIASVKGSKFFEVYIPEIAYMTRVRSEDYPPGIKAEFDKENAVLTIDSVEKTTPQNGATSGEIKKQLAEKRMRSLAAGDTWVGVHLEYHEEGIGLQLLLESSSQQQVDRDKDLVHLKPDISDSGTVASDHTTDRPPSDGCSSTKVQPLSLPCQLRRFSRVPMKVWVTKHPRRGTFSDILTGLIFDSKVPSTK